MQNDRRPPLTMTEVEARRALVRKHLCDLMKSVTRDAKFKDPDEWIDMILDRPRQAGEATNPVVDHARRATFAKSTNAT